MIDIKPSTVLEDSKGNRYFFYHKDSSICYKEISVSGDTKDTILISHVNADYAAAIDTDDTIYLACNSRYKGVLLFIYTNNGWNFEPVLNLHNSSNMYIMDIQILDGSIHIFYSKKLPITNMYNVYHIHKNLKDQTPYVEYSWRKNSLSEIYSQNIESSYSILPLKGGIIHYASVWYDGTYYFINYYCYDDSIKSWLHKSLNISYKSQTFIKLIYHNRKINLLCFSNEHEGNNIHHFLSRFSGASEIDFNEINDSRVNTNGTVPLFYSDDKALQLAWIKDNAFHLYNLDDSTGNWDKIIDLPLTPETNMHVLEIIRNSGSTSKTKGYFLLDRNYNITRPIEHSSGFPKGDILKEKHPASASPEVSDYMKQILGEIKSLTDNVRYLNNRIDNLEGRTFVQKAAEELPNELSSSMPRTAANDIYERPALNKSNFKEKFMKNTRIPNYDSMVLRQENVTTYVGKPRAKKGTGNIPPEPTADVGPTENDKQAFTPPNPESQDESEKKE